MAAAEGQSVCPFPLPPTQYYKLYTDENVDKGLAPGPPPPVEGSYSMFGASFETNESIIQSLETQGITRLYPEEGRVDRISELKKLNCSILVNFLELLDILIKSPSSSKREMKIEDIKLLFINMHHLINELRPHQARETLRVMMQRQKQQRLETASKLQKHIDAVLCHLQSASSSLQTVTANQEEAPGADMEVDENEEKEGNGRPCSRKDHIMCSILEDLT